MKKVSLLIVSVITFFLTIINVDALVVDINPAQNKLILSVRDAVAKERKMEYEKYMASSSDGEGSYTLLDIFSKKEDN